MVRYKAWRITTCESSEGAKMREWVPHLIMRHSLIWKYITISNYIVYNTYLWILPSKRQPRRESQSLCQLQSPPNRILTLIWTASAGKYQWKQLVGTQCLHWDSICQKQLSGSHLDIDRDSIGQSCYFFIQRYLKQSKKCLSLRLKDTSIYKMWHPPPNTLLMLQPKLFILQSPDFAWIPPGDYCWVLFLEFAFEFF